MVLYLTYPHWLHPEIIPGCGFLRWYSLSYILAFLIAYGLFSWLIKRDTHPLMNKNQIADFGFFLMICMVLGGRLGYVLLYDPGYYFSSWQGFISIFSPISFAKNPVTGRSWTFTGIAGLSYHGGTLGIVFALLFTAKKLKIDLWALSDRLLPCLAIAYTLGRLGNFANQELYGKVTASPLGMLFPSAELVLTGEPWAQKIGEAVGLISPEHLPPVLNLPRHPSQLYEAFFEGIFLGSILFGLTFYAKNLASGVVAGSYLLGYGLVRFCIEYLREPDAHLGFIIKLGPGAQTPQVFTSLLNFSMGQILCSLMILAGLAIIVVRTHQARRKVPH